MIKITINDKKITYKELKLLFKEMNDTDKYNASEIFRYNVRSETKEINAIKHSTYVTAREECGCDDGKICVGVSLTGRFIYEECYNCKGMGGRLVGLVRIIGDFTYEYYLSEVMVIPSLQGMGIGKKLMNATLEYCKKDGFMKIFLTAAKGRESYYKRFGFKVTDYNVMSILSKELED